MSALVRCPHPGCSHVFSIDDIQPNQPVVCSSCGTCFDPGANAIATLTAIPAGPERPGLPPAVAFAQTLEKRPAAPPPVPGPPAATLSVAPAQPEDRKAGAAGQAAAAFAETLEKPGVALPAMPPVPEPRPPAATLSVGPAQPEDRKAGAAGQAAALAETMEKWRAMPPVPERGLPIQPVAADPHAPTLERGAAPPRPTSTSPLDMPARIDRFTLRERLGEGAFGVVYRAFDPQLDREVALKIAKQLGERDVEEARAAAQLRHPNIVPVFDAGQDGGQFFIAAAFINGQTLAAAIEDERFAFRRSAQVVRALAEALAYAHHKGIVHRDVKPGNVMLDEQGDPLLTDFGLAARARKSEEPGAGQSERGLGTPAYMAPEQGKGHAVAASDQYSLGCTLYEMLTGQTPFTGPPALQMFLHGREAVPPPRGVDGNIPRDLEAISLKCLAKDPARRYPDCQALADDLRRWLEDEAVMARPAPPWERMRRWRRKYPAQAVAAGLAAVSVALAFIAVAGYGLYQEEQADNARERERTQERARQERENRRQTLDNLSSEAQVAEDAKHLADAQERLGRALAMLQDEPDLAPDKRRDELRQRLDRVVAEQALLATRRADRQTLEDFRKHRDEALYQQISFAGPAQAPATRKSAGEALALFGLDKDGAAQALDNPNYSAEEKKALAAECYELLLIQAEATAANGKESAAEALRLLDRAAAWGQAHQLVTRTYHFRRAACLRLRGADEEARKEDEQGAKVKPGLALDWFLLGLEAYRGDPGGDARKQLDQALRLQADHFWAQYVEALCHVKARQWAAAKAGLTACLSRRPEVPWPRLLRGTAQSELGDHAGAEDDFATVLRQADNDPALHAAAFTARGVARIRARRWEEAVADLQKANSPKSHQGYRNLAQAHQEWASWTSTIGHTVGSVAGAGWSVAGLQARQELAARGIAALDDAIALRPNDPALYHARARLHSVRGDTAAARRDYQRALACRPPADSKPPAEVLASCHVELGYLQHKQREYEAALASADAALKVLPDFAPAHRQRAATLLALHRHVEAGKSIDYLLSRGVRTAEIYLARGLVQSWQGEKAKALESFTQSLQMRPDPGVFSDRGWTFLSLQAPQPALADFESALLLDPRNRDALCGRGLALAHLGKVAAAVQDAEAAMQQQGVPTARVLYNTACIYGRVLAQVEGKGQRERRLIREAAEFERRALQLLRDYMDTVPPDQRAASWRDKIQNEPNLLAIRPATAFLQMARSYGR